MFVNHEAIVVRCLASELFSAIVHIDCATMTQGPVTPPPNPAYRNYVFIVPQRDVRITGAPAGRLYVRADGTLLRSDDRGTTWQTLQTQIETWTIDTHNSDTR